MATSQIAERALDHAFMIGGIVALAFGGTLLFGREATTGVSTLLLGFWWMIHAALILFSMLHDRENSPWKMAVVVLGGAAGLASLIDPIQTEDFLDSMLSVVLTMFVTMIGVIMVVHGIAAIAIAVNAAGAPTGVG